ncbi:MAG: DEAD/DEAH box helicase [Epsilonproteobacteria bacterium]|nr:DEAD/DEAH box helicase [Campylobacterota bacterium]
MTFKDFNLNPKLQKAIEVAEFTTPSPIQELAIPVILQGKDVVGQAHTGTGKTAAFGLPILNMLQHNGGVEAVIIVPTRELATQVSDEIFRFGRFMGINTATVYGGSSYSRQLKHIAKASVIVATPGRFLDLLRGGKIDIAPRFVVLDEADEMLDMGFLDDIKEIFTFMPSDRQTLLFSATMPDAIKDLAQRILHEPEFITITAKDITNTNISQSYYVVEEYERDEALLRLLDFKNPHKAIVFSRTKSEVDRLTTLLVSQGYAAKGLHGDMEQRQREETIRAFKKDLEILVATDVAARGLDVTDVSHVFNYHIPFDSESYVHRIGRTGRAGKEGIAVSIVTPAEFKSLLKIEKTVGSKLVAKEIPTISDIKEKVSNSLITKIEEVDVDQNAIDLIEKLKEEYDLSTIVYKLATLLQTQIKVEGNERIGKSKKQINNIKKRFKNEPSKRKRWTRSRNRRSSSSSNRKRS